MKRYYGQSSKRKDTDTTLLTDRLHSDWPRYNATGPFIAANTLSIEWGSGRTWMNSTKQIDCNFFPANTIRRWHSFSSVLPIHDLLHLRTKSAAPLRASQKKTYFIPFLNMNHEACLLKAKCSFNVNSCPCLISTLNWSRIARYTDNIRFLKGTK